jgi:hypothetical protein
MDRSTNEKRYTAQWRVGASKPGSQHSCAAAKHASKRICHSPGYHALLERLATMPAGAQLDRVLHRISVIEVALDAYLVGRERWCRHHSLGHSRTCDGTQENE